MCLISVAPKGTSKYSNKFLEALKLGGDTNTDGAGFMFKKATSQKVYISKGYNTTEGLIKSLRSHRLKDNDELVVHQRIGNKGAKNTDMCHPFVLSNDKDIILSNDTYVNFPTMCHNGTFHNHSIFNSDYSDTYFFVKDFMHKPELIELMKNDLKFFTDIFTVRLASNRLCFLFPNTTQELIKIGEWKEDEGYYFSNDTYKNNKIRNVGGANNYYPSRYYNHYSEYDDYDDYDAATVGFGSESSISEPKTIEEDTDDDVVPAEEKRWLSKNETPGFQKTLPFAKRDDSGYHKPNILAGEIQVNTGTAVQCNTTGITYRLYMEMWIAEKYNEASQFESIRWQPTIFNFNDFTYKALENDDMVGIMKNTYYKIVSFDNNKTGMRIHVLNRRWPLANQKDRPIFIAESRLSILFSSMPNSDVRDKYKGYYNLCRTVQSSRNTLKRMIGIMSTRKYINKDSIGFKGLILTAESIQIYYLMLMKHLNPTTYIPEISKGGVVLM